MDVTAYTEGRQKIPSAGWLVTLAESVSSASIYKVRNDPGRLPTSTHDLHTNAYMPIHMQTFTHTCTHNIYAYKKNKKNNNKNDRKENVPGYDGNPNTQEADAGRSL